MAGLRKGTSVTGLSVRVIERTDEADAVFALVLAAADGGDLPSWRPGAHIDVAVGESGVRQYSLCGDPADRDRWRIAILHEPTGRGGSAHLYRTALPGSTLSVSLPRNNFELGSAPEYTFVAGGIGITPILPMIAAADRAGARWTLHYGARTKAHMAFADVLTGRYPAVNLVPQDVSGLLPIADILAASPGAAVYCCGPEPLLAAVEAEGQRQGMTVRTERFVPRAVDRTGPDAAFEIQLAQTGRTLRNPRPRRRDRPPRLPAHPRGTRVRQNHDALRLPSPLRSPRPRPLSPLSRRQRDVAHRWPGAGYAGETVISELVAVPANSRRSRRFCGRDVIAGRQRGPVLDQFRTGTAVGSSSRTASIPNLFMARGPFVRWREGRSGPVGSAG